MQQKTFVRQYQMEDDILELARRVSESIVAVATFVAQAILAAVTAKR
jgi:LPS O-antigen subunit length determinant protein (WzzB/FepE family)